jgi:multiple sugar transport system substrate-binding protein
MNLRHLVLCLAASAMLAAMGCAPDGGESGGRGPIVFADGEDTSYGAQIRALVAKWNQSHSDEQVRLVEVPQPSDDHRSQVVAHAQDAAAATRSAGSGDSGGCYDVAALDVIWTAEFARWGYIEPLDPDDFEVDAFLSRPIESGRYQGKLWAIPLRSDVGLLYYRKDLLDAEHAEPPRSWDDLRRQALSIAAGHRLQGYVSQFDQYEGFTVNALESIWDAKGDVLDDDGRVQVPSPNAKEGFRRLTQGFQEKWIPQEATDYNEEGSRIAFQNEGALFLRNWTYAYPLLNGRDSRVAGKVGVAALPGPSALGGWNVALSSCSTRRATARDFIKFLTSEDSERTFFTQAGFAPGRKALYDDPELQREFPYLRVLRNSIEGSRVRPVTPYYDQVSNAVQGHLQPALTRPRQLDAEFTDLAADLRTAADGR